jgi:hypothetical protein
MLARSIVTTVIVTTVVYAQQATLRDAPVVKMPGVSDSNSPAYWRNGGFYLFNSVAMPLRSQGYDQFTLGFSRPVLFDDYQTRVWRWIESVWVDDDGMILAWYHSEPGVVCEDAPLTAPEIGAMYSVNNGLSFFDLGIVLTNGRPADCSSQNGYFAGGNGDFSVILDRNKEFFYFLFSNYGGDVSEQGIAIARLPFPKRYQPAGNVWKYYQGQWNQPGLGGRVTPVLPANVSWAAYDTDSYWGPSVHWNSYLQQYVMLMSRSCCEPNWPAEGIYMSTSADLSKPAGWTTPARLLTNAGWYPQVLGLEEGETDTLAGQTARLYVGGESRWEMHFTKDAVNPDAPETAPEPVASGQRLYRTRPGRRDHGRSTGKFDPTR